MTHFIPQYKKIPTILLLSWKLASFLDQKLSHHGNFKLISSLAFRDKWFKFVPSLDAKYVVDKFYEGHVYRYIFIHVDH